jgi:HD-like signal output (HDOD) protein
MRDVYSELIGMVKSKKYLPAFSQTVVKVISLTDSEGTTIGDLERAIIGDEGFASDVLKLANSAYYGVSRRISRVSEAVLLLGFRTIRNMAFVVSTVDLFSKGNDITVELRRDLWRHSVHCAFLARDIAAKALLPDVLPDDALMAGLIHDVGWLLILEIVGTKEFVRDHPDFPSLPSVEEEMEMWGITHAGAGGMLLEEWNFPPVLSEVVKYHHRNGMGVSLPSLIGLADGILRWIARTRDFTPERSLEVFEEEVDMGSAIAFKLVDMSFGDIVSMVNDAWDGARSIFSMRVF